MTSGGRAFGRWLGEDGEIFMNGRVPSPFPPCEVMNQEVGSHQTLNLGFPNLHKHEKSLLLKSPNLWHFCYSCPNGPGQTTTGTNTENCWWRWTEAVRPYLTEPTRFAERLDMGRGKKEKPSLPEADLFCFLLLAITRMDWLFVGIVLEKAWLE